MISNLCCRCRKLPKRSGCSYCAACQNEYQKEWREKHPEWDRERQRKYRERHPKTGIQLKNQYARDYANTYKRRGKLVKEGKCYFCGSSELMQMHHPNYAEPLRVVWLCRACHRKLHKIIT